MPLLETEGGSDSFASSCKFRAVKSFFARALLLVLDCDRSLFVHSLLSTNITRPICVDVSITLSDFYFKQSVISHFLPSMVVATR